MASEHTDGRYYARDGLVYKAPVQHDEPDGSTSFSLGFPVCKMLEYVGEDAAETVALLMNQGEQATHLREVNAALVEALRDALNHMTLGYCAEDALLERINAALARAAVQEQAP
ncbi:hypothetical protein RGI145_22385 [Roseomonas gilardii]|uniref:Uncharacterized protein n=1 Tax=Roseomonas gilardii TaxID=257708 RepID=A0A1L7AMP4_9PROT|nr:hypothetical protein [Roseomonas gilardii]APT60036.1 hypothetical protein RGI145_22385 [Roseomonas gilardii]